MLVIRFLRAGKKNQPSFKIVVVEKTKSSTSGRFIEEVGFYNPLTKEKVLRQDRIKYWISVGAQPLETVHNLLISEKIIEGKKIDLHNKPKKREEDKSSSSTELPQEAKVEKKEEPSLSSSPSEEGSAKLGKEAPAEAAKPAGITQKEEKKEEAIPQAPAKEEKPAMEVPKQETAEPEASKTETPKEEEPKPAEVPAERPADLSPENTAKEETPKA